MPYNNTIRYHDVDQELKDQIVKDYYEKMPMKEIRLKHNVAIRTLRTILNECNINTNRKNRYTLNENYFENIDSERKAYFLGLIYADGFVGDSSFNNIVLCLKEADKYMLEEFCKEIEFSGEVRNAGKGGYKNSTNRCVVNFSSKKMVDDLNNLGVHTKKSLTLYHLPNIDTSLMRHFLRGYLDGDGSVWVGKNSTATHILATGEKKTYVYKKLSIGFLGTNEILGEIETFINGVEHLGVYFAYRNSKTEGLRYLTTTGIKNTNTMKQYLYDGASIYLKRKYNKWNEIDCPSS